MPRPDVLRPIPSARQLAEIGARHIVERRVVGLTGTRERVRHRRKGEPLPRAFACGILVRCLWKHEPMPDADQGEGQERAKLIRNETAKLTATYVNGVAIALVAIGGLGPVFAQRVGPGMSASDVAYTAASSLLCFALSAALHWAARGFLKEPR